MKTSALLIPLFFWPMATAMAAAPAPTPSAAAEAAPTIVLPPVINPVSQDDLGIQVEALRLSALGNLVDFRFRVLDPVKAAALFDANIKPLLVTGSGKKLEVPSMGQVGNLRTKSRGAPVAAGKVYTMLFGNPGQSVQYGSTVDLLVGNRLLTRLPVKEMPYDWEQRSASERALKP
jgi:hypothetical protein